MQQTHMFTDRQRTLSAAKWWRTSFPYLLLAFAFCIAANYALFASAAGDEIEAMQTAWKMLSGERIYVDFVQHHHPLLYYFLMPVIWIGGETLLSFHLAEALMFAVLVANAVLTYLIADRIYGNHWISLTAVTLLLAFPHYANRSVQIRPDTLMLLFNLVSFYCFVVFLQRRSVRQLIGSALLLSLAFFALQKAIFLVACIGIAQLVYMFRGKMSITHFLLYWTVFCIPMLLYLCYLLGSGGWVALQNYLDFNYLINVRLRRSFSVFDVSLFPVAFDYRALLTPIVAGYLVLLLCGLRSFGWGERDKTTLHLHLLTALCGLTLLFSLFLVRVPWPQYVMLAAPFMAIACAGTLHGIDSIKVKTAFPVAAVLIFAAYLPVNPTFKNQRLEQVEYMLSVTDPEDTIASRIKLFRKDVEFFWFGKYRGTLLDTYQTFRDYPYDFASVMTCARPTIIRVDVRRYDEALDNLLARGLYRRSDRYSVILIRNDASGAWANTCNQ